MQKKNDHPSVAFLESLYQYCDEGFINLRFLPSAENLFIPLPKLNTIPFIVNSHQSQNCYFGVATRRDGDGSKNGIVEIPSLWCDVDVIKGSPAYDQFKQVYKDFPLKPSMLINSGGGYHLYWPLKEPASKSDISRVEDLLKRIASHLGGDMAAAEAARILRVPGTYNLKNTPKKRVTIGHFNPEKQYNLDDFDFLPPLPAGKRAGRDQAHAPGWEQDLLKGVSDGERNTSIAKLAGRYVGKGLSREEILPILLDANSRFDPPLEMRVVETTLESVTKTDERNHPDRLEEPSSEQPIEEMIQGASLETLPEILKRLSTLKETEQAVHINALAKQLNITKRAIKKDIESLFHKKEDHPDIDKLLEDGANPKSNFSAQNFIDGVLSYGAILGKERALVRSDGEIILADGSDGDSFRFKRSSLTAEGIKRFRAGEDVDGRDLLKKIQTLFSDHVIFKNSRIPILLAVWILGTYLFKVFQYYGYLWVNSPVKRCGKSLLLDILSLICFNATSRLVDPSPSFLFREVDCNDGTLILDEIESLGGADKDKKSELISLLNAGFQRGSQAPRMESKNREFVVTYFSAYSPKALAGIKSVVDTIEDRSFKIAMTRKKKSEAVKRFNLRALGSHIAKIREDCFLWALRYTPDVAEVYGEDESFTGTELLDDRLKDIVEPLLSIASVIDAQADDETAQTVNTLTSLAEDMAKGRDDQEALSGSIPAVVNLIQGIIDGAEERFISADDLFSRFQADDDLGFVKSKRGLAFFLAKLNLHRTPLRRIGDKVTRGYLVTSGWVKDLSERYV